MLQIIGSRIKPYAVAVLAVVSALLLTLLLQQMLAPTILPLFFAAVAVSAWYGGMEPGLLATALCILSIEYFFIPPIHSLGVLNLDDLVRLGVFVFVTLVISSLNSQLRYARGRLEIGMQKLQASEARFRRLVESNIIGVIVADINGVVVEANDAFLNMVGYTREDMLSGRVRWREMTPPEYRQVSDRSIEELRATGVCTPFEKEYIRKDGSRVPIFLGSAFIGSEQQEIIAFVLDLSDRKLAEVALKKSEERYRVFVEQSSEGIWRFELEQPLSPEFSEDEQLQHFYQYAYLAECNNVMAQMYNFTSAEEIIGARLEDFLISSDPHNLEYLRNFIRSGYRLVDGESHELDKEGNLKYILNNLVGIVENGVLVRVWGTQRDITERKQAEAALRESEKRLRRLVESNIFGVAFGDFKGKILYANDYFLKMVGYTNEELLSGEMRWDAMTPPEYLVLDAQAAEELRKHGVATPFEKEYIRKDGSHVPILIGGALLQEPYDRQQEIISFYLDLSDRQRAEAALKESEERFRKLAEKVRVIPWEADPNADRFTYVGPQTVEILGYPLLDWYADHFWVDHIYPEDREWLVEYCLNSSAVLDNYEFEYRMLTADGRIVWLYDIVNVVRGKDGPQLLRGFMIDITDRKRAEEEREQLLTREQAARAEAEEASRMKDEFLATLSHELRTPLNAMLGWTQLLQTRKLDQTATARALETIDRNTRLLAQLIEDVLDVSRIIRGKLRLNLTPVELIPVIEAAIETVMPAAEAKNIQIEFLKDLSVEAVLGDANRLQQVVWNLLSNAVKFTPNGGRVEVRLELVNCSAQIQVRDTGQGISADFLPYVFERFRQADSSMTRTHGGLGLGLAIVRHLVELHGGTVHAESPGIGQGSSFKVKLPILKAGVASSPTSEQRKSAPTALASLSGVRVLVVDDEADARNLLNTMLSQHGAEVKTAATAAEAVAALQQFIPDVLVSDIGMPEEDGYSLIRKVRALDASLGGQVPAVALTAYARAEDRAQALLAGFQLHVPKPVNAAELVVVVARLAGS